MKDDFIKVVVDLERRIIAIGCELHIDCAEELVNDGSLGKDLWGVNIYPQKKIIDFVSMINIRPADGNRSMEIELPSIRRKVEEIVKELLPL